MATCRLPRHCLRCHGFGHIARDCKRPRSNDVATASTCHSSPLLGVCALGGRAWSWTGSLCFGSVTVKATSGLPADSSTPHAPSVIPAAGEVAVDSSLPQVSFDDFFDPIASEMQAVPAHERWDPMRSEGLVVREKPSGVGVPAGGAPLPAQCGSTNLAARCSPWVGSSRGSLCRIRKLGGLSCCGPAAGL